MKHLCFALLALVASSSATTIDDRQKITISPSQSSLKKLSSKFDFRFVASRQVDAPATQTAASSTAAAAPQDQGFVAPDLVAELPSESSEASLPPMDPSQYRSPLLKSDCSDCPKANPDEYVLPEFKTEYVDAAQQQAQESHYMAPELKEPCPEGQCEKAADDVEPTDVPMIEYVSAEVRPAGYKPEPVQPKQEEEPEYHQVVYRDETCTSCPKNNGEYVNPELKEAPKSEEQIKEETTFVPEYKMDLPAEYVGASTEPTQAPTPQVEFVSPLLKGEATEAQFEYQAVGAGPVEAEEDSTADFNNKVEPQIVSF